MPTAIRVVENRTRDLGARCAGCFARLRLADSRLADSKTVDSELAERYSSGRAGLGAFPRRPGSPPEAERRPP